MFPELFTHRFRLEKVLPQDQAFIFKGLSDPVIMPYNGVYYPTFEATGAQLEWYDQNYQEGTGINWKITDKLTSEPRGVISFYFYKPAHRKAEVGFWILPEFWNKGITTEVLQAVIIYCQQVKQIHRLEAFVEAENVASSKVLEKSGFQYEGTMRDCEIKFGKFINLKIYSLVGNSQL